MRVWPWVACLVLGCATARTPRPDFAAVERAHIAELELARDTRDGALVSRARIHADPTVRARALVALGRIQDLDTAPTVAEALTDPVPAVRTAAAFAAGELALAWEPVPDAIRQLLARALLTAEAKEVDAPAQLAELEALGRVRTPEALERLSQRLALRTEESPERATRAALSLGVALRAKAPAPQSARARLETLARSYLPATRWAAIYALGQFKISEARAALLNALGDSDPEVRAVALKGLAEVIQPEDLVLLRPQLKDDDGRVAAEAVRALLKLADTCAPGPCPPLEALVDLGPRIDAVGAGTMGQLAPPLLALAQSQVPEGGRRFLTDFRARLSVAQASGAETVRTPLAWLDCRLAAAQDRQRGWLDEVRGCGGGLVPEARRLRVGLDAVGQSPRLPEALVRETWLPLLRHESPSVRAAAAQVAAAAKKPELARDVRPLLQDDDAVVRAAAAESLGALGERAAAWEILSLVQTPPAVDVVTSYTDALLALRPDGVEQTFRSWLSDRHVHVRQEAARALNALRNPPALPETPTQPTAGEFPGTPPVRAPMVPSPPEAPPASPVAKGTLWQLQTARGPVVIQPAVEEAPHTVAQLSRLARAGFFRGLTFHRVVPDFVVQGGDPRGDGEGGPGFTLPCEVSNTSYRASATSYRRGTVGMALAGKDTGGSQFFVALAPQPHLDGRYTVIGTVLSGMEALDGLVEGDTLGDWAVITP
jgi:cyclophilin family peptidyl-prolyl cis-trans isomerase/HEAT repeat protein